MFVQAREQAGKEVSPTVASVDRQSDKTAEKRGAHRPEGLRAGKKISGKKRHILVDTLGVLLSAPVHPADVQDRDGAIPLLRAAGRMFPFVKVVFADGAYQGAASAFAQTGRWRLEIVRRTGQEGFVPLPKRWIVDRPFTWRSRCRRLAKDFDNLARNALAFLRLGMIRLMLRRLARRWTA